MRKSLYSIPLFVALLLFHLSQAGTCPEHCNCNSQGQCTSCEGNSWWGATCSNACPVNCYFGRCYMSTGQCVSCLDTWWGTNCSIACPEQCTSKLCDRNTGQCSSCNDGWWGPTCSNACPEHCYFGQCRMNTGCCFSCEDGYSGNCTCSIPSQSTSPQGVNCDWYSTCLDADTKDCPIINNTMCAKCHEYADLESSLSSMGAKWSQYVRSCLQKTLANNVLIPALSGSVDCQTATDVFFGDHVGCYLNGPISFCQLPYGDIARIVLHGASIIFSTHWYDPLVTGAQLKYACDLDFWETALQDLSSQGRILQSNGSSCIDADTTASLVASMNQRLAPQNWTIYFESADDVTKIEGTSILLLSSLDSSQYPLNVTLATELALDSMQEWQANNTQCNLTFNGQNIGPAEKQEQIATLLN